MTNNEREPNPFPLLTLSELLDLKLPEREWVVENILPLGSFTMLAAREKAGKSLIGVDVCCSVALDESFLDRAVRQGPVVLIPAEDNMTTVQERVAKRTAGRSGAEIYTFPSNGFWEDRLLLDKGESLLRLIDTIKQVQPVVVWMDPMREMHELSENDADEMAPLLRPVRQIAHHYNIAILMNHHMSRAGTSRGSTAIRAAVDQEWAFKRDDDESMWETAPAKGIIKIEGRFGPKQIIGVAFSPESARWEAGPVLLTDNDASAHERLVGLLRLYPDGLTSDEIATHLNVTRKTVQNTVTTMLRGLRPPIVASGRGVRGQPCRYHAIDPFLIRPDRPDVPDGTNRTNTESDQDSSRSSQEDRESGRMGRMFNGKDATATCAGCGRCLDSSRSSCPFCGQVTAWA